MTVQKIYGMDSPWYVTHTVDQWHKKSSYEI